MKRNAKEVAASGWPLLLVAVVCQGTMPVCTQCDNPVSIDFVQAHGDGETVNWCPPCRDE
ncbi:hypothetical protein [Natrialba chahannaoensis]|uniref:hypothetical protein n=1 Tax=Natrialba chahannaoensis TaxID=68911 RepID=UPI0006780FC2|nr:hypothetical protein [Natrialba chahannaoensis]